MSSYMLDCQAGLKHKQRVWYKIMYRHNASKINNRKYCYIIIRKEVIIHSLEIYNQSISL